MYENVTLMVNGIAVGLFGLTSALFLFVFKRNRLRTVLGIILGVYAVYLFKDIIYYCPAVADDKYIYRILLSIDNWAVPLYVVYAFEVISPNRMNVPKMLLLLSPFFILTLVYAVWPLDWVFSFQVAFASLFSALCMCIVLYKTLKYRRSLLDNCSDITNMDIRWMWVSIALFLPNLGLWTLLSGRLDYALDSVYYATLSLSWGIVAYHTYYFVPQSDRDCTPECASPVPSAASNFIRKLNFLASDGYFVRSPRLTLSELAAQLGTNRTTLSNYLNQELGTTFYDYINSKRISRAEELLSNPACRYSVEQLAELSGFNSLSTFRRAFHKKHGMSPQRYRENMLQGR